MNTISTISELLTLSQCQFRIYEIGRKVEKLSKETFNKVELNHLPYPSPLQGFAHVAIVFWQKSSKEPYLWFIKLPLDERGLLNQGARNHFLAIITEALGSDLSVDPTEKQEELLKSNPYIFTPPQYKLAMINSFLSKELRKSPSKYHEKFISYLKNESWSQWHEVGVQGINDFVARLNEEGSEALLNNTLAYLPHEVLQPLCSALENINLPVNTINSILPLMENSSSDENKTQYLIRSLASSTTNSLAHSTLTNLLSKDNVDLDILICLSGRCWEMLNSAEVSLIYLEQVAKHKDNEVFAAIFSDLVAIPSIRPHILHCLRSTDRTEALSQAIGHLFKSKS